MKSHNNVFLCSLKGVRVSLFFVIALCLSCLVSVVAGCSSPVDGAEGVSASVSQDDGAVIPRKTDAETAGTLTWSGYLSGKKIFETSGCTLDPSSKELVYIAPFQGKKLSYGGLPGPQLTIDFHSKDDAKIIFTTDNRDDSEDVQFVQYGVTEGDGVILRKDGDNYVVSLKHFKIPNINYVNQRHIFLDGVLTCTRMEK